MTMPGRINVHTHIFNLQAVLTPYSVEIVKKRIAEEVERLETVPGVARKQLARLLEGTVEDLLDGIQDINEKALLGKFLKRVAGHDDVMQLLAAKAGRLPEEVRALVADRVEGLLLRRMRRVFSWVSGRLRKDHYADFRKGDIHDIFEMLRIAGQPDIRGVCEWLLRQLGPDDIVVALMMDLTAGDDADTPAFRRQLVDTSKMVLTCPGRVLPFVKVNSLRTGELVLNAGQPDEVKLKGHFEIMKHALEHLGYVGVKIYPSLGYAVDSEPMKAVYAYCQEHGVPLLMHCNKSGFLTSPTSFQHADPGKWAPILEQFPRLKICFAHFGGASNLAVASSDTERWGNKILELMAYEGVYCDIAFHRTPMDGDQQASRYRANIERILSDPDRGDRVLFGTDYWLIRPRLTEANHWKFFEQLIGTERFDQIAKENPQRFLGMADGSNDALGNYLDLIASRHQEIEAMPATWLLAAVEERRSKADRNRLESAGARFLPARELVIDGWRQRLAGLAGKALSNGLSFDARAGRSMTAFGGTKIGFEADAQFSVRTLDASSGSDEDGILLPSLRPTATDLTPVLDAEPGRSWLKYRLAAKLDVDAVSRLESLGFGIDAGASKELVFTDYRVHDPASDLASAVRSDLSSPRFAISRESVLKLKQNEAVSIQQRGTLRGKVTISLCDVFTGSLERLSKMINAGQTLKIRADLAATVTAKVRITDDFKVVFARRGGMYSVAVRKQDTNSKTLRAELATGIQFDDPAAASSVIRQLVAQHLAEPVDKLAALREKGEAAVAAAGGKQLLGRLEEKLGKQGLAAVLNRLDRLEEQWSEAVEQVAKGRVSVGFAYEYSRLEQGTAIMEATMDELTLMELHEQLVQGDLTEALERVRDGVPGITLERYLRLERIVRRHAWGFNFGGFGRVDVRERRFAAQRGHDGERLKLSLHGSRSYTDPKTRCNVWKVDFHAGMRDLLPARQLALGTADGGSPPFEYGLALLMEWQPGKLRMAKLRSILDTASTWGVLPEDPRAIGRQVDELQGYKLSGKAVSFRLQLSFDHRILGELLEVANDGNLGRWASALAAAMPWAKRKPHASPGRRRQLYAPLWQDLLERSQDDHFVLRPAAAAKSARTRLREENMGSWSAVEFDDQGAWRNNPFTLGGVLALNAPIAPWRSFRLGLDRLERALGDDQQLDERQVKERIWAIHQSLSAFWTQAHHVRAVGAYLRACAQEAGVSSRAPASLSARWEAAGEREESLTLARV